MPDRLFAASGNPRRPALWAFGFLILGMTGAHLQGMPQLLTIALVVLVVHAAVRGNTDRMIAGGLCLTGFAIELLRILTVPSVVPPTNDIVEVTGVVAGPVRHSGDYWSSDLVLAADDSKRGQLRTKLLVPDSLSTLVEGVGLGVRGRFSALSRPRNPGQTDWDASLRRKGGIGTVWADSTWAIAALGDQPGRPRAEIRTAIERVISGVIGSEEGHLALAVLVGIRDGIDQETFDNFREAGIIHILAISGLHVLVVVGLLFGLGQLLFPGYRLPALFAVFGLGAYVYVVGPQASVVRAAIMGAAVLFGLVFNRRSDPANSIGLAGIGLLVLTPRFLWEPGFQLSFSATLGILLFTPSTLELIGGAPRYLKWLIGAMAASLGAQLGVFPFVLHHFHQWPSYGLLTNIPAVLLLTVLLWTTLATLFVGVVWPAAAVFTAYGARLSVRGLEFVAGSTATLPGAVNLWGAPSTWLLAIIWCGIIGALLGRRCGRGTVAAIVGVLLGAIGWLVWSIQSPWEAPVDRLVMQHVRGGNCLILERPGKHLSLLDPGGPGRSASAVRSAEAYMRFRRCRKYHTLLATGTSKYRFGAAPLLCSEALVAELVAPAFAEHELDPNTIRFSTWGEGTVFALGKRFRALPLGVSSRELDGLLVTSHRGMRVLLSGEGDWKADARMAARSDVQPVDVLYVGPPRTTGPSHLLLRRIRPRLVVLSESRRMESGLVDRLVSSGYRVACTENGAVIVECTGGSVTWRQWQSS